MEEKKSEINKIREYKLHDFENVHNLKDVNNHHPRPHFIIVNFISLVFALGK